MLNYRPNGRRRFRRPFKRLSDEAGTDPSRLNSWQLMMMMMMTMMMRWRWRWQRCSSVYLPVILLIFLLYCRHSPSWILASSSVARPHLFRILPTSKILTWLNCQPHARPQPGGPGYRFLSGSSPLTHPSRQALPSGIAFKIIWPRNPHPSDSGLTFYLEKAWHRLVWQRILSSKGHNLWYEYEARFYICRFVSRTVSGKRRRTARLRAEGGW